MKSNFGVFRKYILAFLFETLPQTSEFEGDQCYELEFMKNYNDLENYKMPVYPGKQFFKVMMLSKSIHNLMKDRLKGLNLEKLRRFM
tara:strand:+ start:274 stop:534 length:261 start_codon:yes stop_codon:yes gene_type:complete